RIHLAQRRRLVRVVDLVATKPAADPGHRDALRIARRPMLESEVARRRRPGVEMLMEGLVRRHDQRPDLPIITLGFLAFPPHQRIAFAVEQDDMRARTMRMSLLVGADAEL